MILLFILNLLTLTCSRTLLKLLFFQEDCETTKVTFKKKKHTEEAKSEKKKKYQSFRIKISLNTS